MNVNETLNKIKALFAEPVQPVAPQAPPAPAVFSDYQLADGTVVSISELAPGGSVMIGDQPAPAGEHALADGTIIVVAEGGTITEVKAPAAPAAPAEPAEADDMGARFEAIEGRFASMEQTITKQGEMIQAFDAALRSQGEITKQLLAVVEQLAKTPSADPAEAPRQSFSKNDGKVSRMEKIERLAQTLKELKNK